MERVVATMEIRTYQLEEFINIMLTSDYVVEVRKKDDRNVLVLVKEKFKERVEE